MLKKEENAGGGDFAAAEEKFTEAEKRFERSRRTIGIFAGPVIAVIIFFLPLRGLSREAHTLAAIISWVVTWWVSEAIPIPATAVLGAALCIVSGVADARTVFAPFADPIIFLFMGSFLLARAMSVHELDRRFAYALLSLRLIGNSAGRILFVYGAVCALLSMWISNTATTAMMFPIGIGIISALAEMMARQTGQEVHVESLRFTTGMMLMAAYASSTGGIGTPVGTPPNLIGLAMIEKFTQVKIPFFRWMMFAVPLLVITYLVLFSIMVRLHKPEVRRIQGSREFVQCERARLGPWTRGQKNTLVAFLVAVVLWIMPGFLTLISGQDSPLTRGYSSRVPEAVAAVLAALLLFIFPINWKKRKFTLTWRQALQIDWGTLLLFGGGLSLGDLMFRTGLAETLGKGLLDLCGATSLWGLTLVGIFLATFVSEITSNTAVATMVVPIMISVSLAGGLNPIPPAIGATIGASYAFMLPVSTPPNAIVYGSGLVPITRMIRAGALLNIAGGLVIWASLRILLPFVGLA
ncbi:MAG: DASS family sodium-coupled anion symporter [Clostridiales bacterium]|nr:DASS family sodium-coupled anion symporter [Clostridiales bacterium]